MKNKTPRKMGRPSVPDSKRLKSKSFQFTADQLKFIESNGGASWLRDHITKLMVTGGSDNNV
ncbi:MAG: hypothetical protein KAR42_11190 [candidate division Zixibacteria bacterium]|nr:hypothetical protein [candidate division Zixibacteria bacterium]